MNIATKLSAYGAALVLLTGGAYVVGSAVGPLAPVPASVGHQGTPAEHAPDTDHQPSPDGHGGHTGAAHDDPQVTAHRVLSPVADGAPLTAGECELTALLVSLLPGSGRAQ